MVSVPGVDLCQFPAATPPAGTVPNFKDPPSHAPALIGVTSVMISWAAIFLLGRLWVSRHRFHVADVCAILAFTFCVAYSGLIFCMLDYMRHQYDIPACWFDATYVKLNCAMQILMPLAHTFSKAAIFFLLFQIFSINRKMKVAIYGGLVFVVLVYGSNFIVGPLYSVPYAGETWDDMLINRRPAKLITVGLVQAVFAVVIDLYIFFLPFPILKSLNLKTRKRIQLAFVFGTALMGVIASVIGLALRVPLLTSEDSSWVQGQVFICIMVEIYIAVIVSCLPAFANFSKVYISSSSFYKSLTSIVTSHKSNSDGTGFSSSSESWRMRARNARNKPSDDVKLNANEFDPYQQFQDTVDLTSTWNGTTVNEATVGSVYDLDEPESGIPRRYQIDQPHEPRRVDLGTNYHIQHA
ncbi:unnamed protein product [Clonostachys rosea]|uniref:Rhodopsin domain-containing protein n=1 Tax=Bionectria ochroleuca TaxID=29856 RepID=A0ABY6UY86_BIOOC|nr:unnamed protein product [Clonostachys rosea]